MREKIDRVVPDQPTPARPLRQLAEAAERLARLRVARRLVGTSGGHGDHWRDGRPGKILAQLSGAASPYSWAEGYRTAGGWALLSGGRSGTANAHEMNGRAGLGGKWVELDSIGGAWFDFLWVARGAAAPPATCVRTVNVSNRGGAALSGVPVTLLQGASTIASGTTDGSGNFSSAALPTATAYTWKVVYDGLTLTGVAAGCSTATVCFCKASVAVTTTPADAAVAFPTLAPPFGGGGVASNTTEDLGGGTRRWTYRELSRCSAASALPTTVGASATKAGHVGRCKDFSLHCGDALTWTVALFYYADRYFSPSCACPVLDCSALGDGPDNASISPKGLEVNWDVIYNPGTSGVPAPGPIAEHDRAYKFGTDAGVWTTVNWDGLDGNGLDTYGGSHWDNGCQGGHGTHMNCAGGVVLDARSTRIEVWCNHDENFMEVLYSRWRTTDCGTTASTDCGSLPTVTSLAGGTATDSGLCSPVNIVFNQLLWSGAGGSTYILTCSIREAP